MLIRENHAKNIREIYWAFVPNFLNLIFKANVAQLVERRLPTKTSGRKLAGLFLQDIEVKIAKAVLSVLEQEHKARRAF